MNAPLTLVGARGAIAVEVERITAQLVDAHENCKYFEVRFTKSPHIDAPLSSAWYRIGEAIRALEAAADALKPEETEVTP